MALVWFCVDDNSGSCSSSLWHADSSCDLADLIHDSNQLYQLLTCCFSLLLSLNSHKQWKTGKMCKTDTLWHDQLYLVAYTVGWGRIVCFVAVNTVIFVYLGCWHYNLYMAHTVDFDCFQHLSSSLIIKPRASQNPTKQNCWSSNSIIFDTFKHCSCLAYLYLPSLYLCPYLLTINCNEIDR